MRTTWRTLMKDDDLAPFKFLASWFLTAFVYIYDHISVFVGLSAFALNVIMIVHTIWRIRRGHSEKP